MGRVKELMIKAKEQDDIHNCTVAEIQMFVETVSDFVDCDDLVGNTVMNYILANVDDIASVINKR